MPQEFQSNKHFKVGDLFLKDNEPLCYIVKITQWKKGAQYEYQMEYFKERTYSNFKYLNTLRLNDKLTYWGWKHIPVVK